MTDELHFQLGEHKVYLSDVDHIVEQRWKRGGEAFISFVTSQGGYFEASEPDPEKSMSFAKQAMLLWADVLKRQGQL